MRLAMTQDELKQAVARAAIEYVVEGEIVGVGTGSTANFFIDVLGNFPLPVEVIPMAQAVVARKLAALGGEPRLRLKDGVPLHTDNGNVIIDVVGLKIDNPVEMEAIINNIVGVVTVGLFARQG